MKKLIDANALRDIFYRYKRYGLDDDEERIHNAAIDQCIIALNAAPDIQESLNVEDLKIIADKLGYRIIKKQKRLPKFLPCKCGYNRRRTWYMCGSLDKKMFYQCRKCGFKSNPGKSEREAMDNWNREVSAV